MDPDSDITELGDDAFSDEEWNQMVTRASDATNDAKAIRPEDESPQRSSVWVEQSKRVAETITATVLSLPTELVALITQFSVSMPVVFDTERCKRMHPMTMPLAPAFGWSPEKEIKFLTPDHRTATIVLLGDSGTASTTLFGRFPVLVTSGVWTVHITGTNWCAQIGVCRKTDYQSILYSSSDCDVQFCTPDGSDSKRVSKLDAAAVKATLEQARANPQVSTTTVTCDRMAGTISFKMDGIATGDAPAMTGIAVSDWAEYYPYVWTTGAATTIQIIQSTNL